MLGTRWRSWLRHCATSQKVEVSVPDGVIGIFHWHNPFGRTMALGLTQPLTEMSTRNISWGVKAAGAYGWQPYHPHVPIVLKSGSLNFLETLGPAQACNGIALPLLYLWHDDGLVIEAETCCHLVTLNKINIHNTSCVLTYESLLLTCKIFHFSIYLSAKFLVI